MLPHAPGPRSLAVGQEEAEGPPPLRDHVPPRRAPAPADRPTALTAGLPPCHLLPGNRGTRSPTRAADVALAPTTSLP